ncbi:MAG: histidine triad nucleotide-binding protein [Candidatus Melainabacteria bacterium]|jgi:histidine triad (HIT) family protein|nr:histidine triad nucleotide-binding protein [Candidatus Melainabacteria bacterium]
MGLDDCIFCKIIKGEIPSEKLYETEQVIAFKDISPASPHHYLIIPKIHKASLNEFDQEHKLILGEILLAAKEIAVKQGFAESGYRTVINTGKDGGQTVHHLHMHLLAGREHKWPPG